MSSKNYFPNSFEEFETVFKEAREYMSMDEYSRLLSHAAVALEKIASKEKPE